MVRMCALGFALITTAVAVGAAPSPSRATVTGVRVWAGPEQTRVVLDLSAPSKHSVFTLTNPDRLVIDLAGASLATAEAPQASGLIKNIRTGARPEGVRVVLDLVGAVRPRSFLVPPNEIYGHRLVLDLEGPPGGFASAQTSAPATTPVIAPAAPLPTVTASAPVAPASSSATVALTPGAMATAGLSKEGQMQLPSAPSSVAAAPTTAPKRPPFSVLPTERDIVVAIDAGHGGEDPGARGRKGTKEKDVTLAIARKLKERVDAQPGMRGVLVREGDYFIKLETRPKIARDKFRADMFISVHADAFKKSTARGSSVFVLSNRGATSTAAKWLADRENAADLIGGVSLSDKDDVVASVLLDLSQTGALNASYDVAGNVLRELDGLGNLHKSQVQAAGFVVLKAPDIPSILVETAFITNPEEESRLRDPAHQGRVADAILKGVKAYFRDNPPDGSRLASR